MEVYSGIGRNKLFIFRSKYESSCTTYKNFTYVAYFSWSYMFIVYFFGFIQRLIETSSFDKIKYLQINQIYKG